MSATVKVVADSISPAGKRITTMALRYWRPIHPEFMTHRDFSRNASSSRAIPIQKMIDQVVNDPAMPVHWGANQRGMQAAAELAGTPRTLAQAHWLSARDNAVATVQHLDGLGLHKQLANRLLEPWMYITVLVTATEWGNFFNLRYHPDAQPEIQELAKLMWKAQEESVPEPLGLNEWHLPYIKPIEKLAYPLHTLRMMSAARCARVSYLNNEGKEPTLVEDMVLYDRLVGGNPKHASPTEHQAMPLPDPRARSGNFCGWLQHRKLIDGEYSPKFQGPAK